MIALLAAHRLYVLLGSGLLALGLFVLLHPELFRGASLMLIGLAALERGSAWVRRMLRAISKRLRIGGPPAGGRGGGLRVAYGAVRQRWSARIGTLPSRFPAASVVICMMA